MGSHPPRADRRLWILNLDAERELATLAAALGRGRRSREAARFQPNLGTRALLRDWAPRAARRLAGPGDLIQIDGALYDAASERRDEGEAQGLEAHAWSPTPHARWLADSLGAELTPGPPLETLLTVNARPFTAALPTDDRVQVRKRLAADLDTVLALIRRPAPRGWLVRSQFGVAGSGRKHLHVGQPLDPEQRWLAKQLRHGPVVVEPWVEITAETTRCARLHRDGTLEIAAPGLQSVDRFGQWLDTEAAAPSQIKTEDDQRLLTALETAGRALYGAGYWGPFGIDAFWHRDLAGSSRVVLQPLSEINARYTMDWSD